jgi:uncharacterized protein (TIGR03083 family)
MTYQDTDVKSDPVIDAMIEQLADLRALVNDLSDEEMELPTRCPGWRVAELVGHCEAIIVMFVSDNAVECEGAPEIRRTDVYSRDTESRADTERHVASDRRIHENAVEYSSGRRPSQLRTSFVLVTDGVIAAMPTIPPDLVVFRPPNYPRMTYRELMASRLVEIGVHASDIANAVGRPEDLSPAAADIVVDLYDELLGTPLPEALGWDATHYILAASGRVEVTPEERELLGPLAEKIPLPFYQRT